MTQISQYTDIGHGSPKDKVWIFLDDDLQVISAGKSVHTHTSVWGIETDIEGHWRGRYEVSTGFCSITPPEHRLDMRRPPVWLLSLLCTQFSVVRFYYFLADGVESFPPNPNQGEPKMRRTANEGGLKVSDLTPQKIAELRGRDLRAAPSELSGDLEKRSSFGYGFSIGASSLVLCALALSAFAADPTPEQLQTMREFGLTVPPVLYDVHGKIKGEKAAPAPKVEIAEIVPLEDAPHAVVASNDPSDEFRQYFSPYVEPMPSIEPKNLPPSEIFQISLDLKPKTDDKKDRLGSADKGAPVSTETPPPLSTATQLSSGPRQTSPPILSIKAPAPAPIPSGPTQEQLDLMRQYHLSVPPTIDHTTRVSTDQDCVR